MKKILFALLAITTLSLSSCSKEQTINRQLDGSWNATIVDDVAVPSGTSVTYTFSKDKKGKGTGTYTASGFGAFDGTYNFNYTIVDDKITWTYTNSSVSEVYTVSDHSKKDMTFTNTDGEKTVLEAK